jgi:hypothetical protein
MALRSVVIIVILAGRQERDGLLFVRQHHTSVSLSTR